MICSYLLRLCNSSNERKTKINKFLYKLMPKCPYDNHVRLEFKDKICSCKDPLVLVTHSAIILIENQFVCSSIHMEIVVCLLCCCTQKAPIDMNTFTYIYSIVFKHIIQEIRNNPKPHTDFVLSALNKSCCQT